MNIGLLGTKGEEMTARFLHKNGYTVLKRNYQCRYGEIDIIAEKDGIICFAEVKTRSEGQHFSPAEAVDKTKEENIRNAASAYISRCKITSDIRFDIIEVLLDDKAYKIRHIRNAF